MRNFFRLLQQVHNPPEVQTTEHEPLPLEETSEFKALARQYVHFCQSRQSGNSEQSLEDLKILIGLPEISHIAFRDGEQGFELLIGIKHVYITAKNTRKVHDIGEFIIAINRKEKRMRFINITGPMHRPIEGGGFTVAYHHPHVNEKGEMCITSGRDIINEFLTEGKISSAVRMLIKALHTVDDVPFHEARLDNWPLTR